MTHRPPPKGDPRREAVDSIRGIDYQILQSVHAWLTLGPQEDLYLEIAEDFAQVAASGNASVSQVKHRTRNVTLGSKDVLDAIRNFWLHKKNNPGQELHLSFLTTASRGREKRRPFGSVNGLDVWDACKREGADLTRLRAFLSAKVVLPDDLRAFIRTANDNELRAQLISRVAWLTETASKAGIRQSIERLLVGAGERFGLLPKECRDLVPRLYTHVVDVICDAGERRLVRSDFLEILQSNCFRLDHARQPNEMRRIGEALTNRSGLPDAESSSIDVAPSPHAVLVALRPVLAPEMLPRTKLVSALSPQLLQKGSLTLVGSTGMGKSVLAELVAHSIPGTWVRLDCRGLSDQQVRFRLERAAIELSGMTHCGCILDDLPLSGDGTLFENALAGLLYDVRERKIPLLVTAERAVPSAVAGRIGLPSDGNVSVPPFSDVDISDLLSRHGCPQELVSAWTKLVTATTVGHPQIAHASIRQLQSDNWPAPTTAALTNPAGLDEVKRHARLRLETQLPSQPARALAYRLSIFIQPFTREHALALAGIPNPGEAFDRLLGPWIEPIGDNRFRLSPLLRSAAQETFSKAETLDLHRAAAVVLLSRPNVTPSEVSGGLFHSVMGGNALTLGACLRALDEASPSDFRAICPWIDWILPLHAIPLFPTNPFASFMLRRLQYRVAVMQEEHDRAIEVVREWERELDSYQGIEPTRLASLRLMFLTMVLFEATVPFAYTELLARTLAALTLLRAEVIPEPLRLAEVESSELADVLCESLIRRCRTANDVEVLLHALGAQDDVESSLVLDRIRQDPGLAIYLLTVAVEPQLDERSPTEVIERVLDQGAVLGRVKGLEVLTAASYRGSAILKAEIEQNSVAAFQALDNAARELRDSLPITEEYRARVYLEADRLEEALEVWRRILPRWTSGAAFERALAYRHASVAAGRLEHWREAADFSAHGEPLIREAGFDWLAAGMRADQAMSLWFGGDRRAAVVAVADVLDQLERLPDPQANFHSLALRKLVGNAILWMLTQTPGSGYQPAANIAQPTPGSFSQFEFHPLLKTLPLASMDITWSLLGALETLVAPDGPIRERWMRRTGKSAVPAARSQGDWIRLQQLLRETDLDELVSVAVAYKTSADALLDYTEAGRDTFEKQATGPRTPTSRELLETVQVALSLGLLALAAQGRTESAPLDVWRHSAVALGIAPPPLDDWLGFVRECMKKPTQAIPVLRCAKAPWPKRLTAAVFAVAAGAPPEAVFYGLALILEVAHRPPWAAGIELHLERLASDVWSRIAKEQRFALLSPSLYAPIILQACEDPKFHGLSKVARILIAARDAVNVGIPKDVLDLLKSVAREPPANPT